MTHYGPDEPRSAANLPPSKPLSCPEPSLTRQSDAFMTDINYIMEKYQKTGYLPPLNRDVFFADVTNVTSFNDALTIVHGIEDTFMQLPAHVRKRFNNDPAQFIDFTNDAENLQEMRDMGLIKPEQERPTQIDIDAAVQRIIQANRETEQQQDHD